MSRIYFISEGSDDLFNLDETLLIFTILLIMFTALLTQVFYTTALNHVYEPNNCLNEKLRDISNLLQRSATFYMLADRQFSRA